MGSALPPQEDHQMPKTKEQKKKDRERRVAQKKFADVQKRTQEQKILEAQKAAQKTNILAAAAAPPKPSATGDDSKQSFGHRRSVS